MKLKFLIKLVTVVGGVDRDRNSDDDIGDDDGGDDDGGDDDGGDDGGEAYVGNTVGIVLKMILSGPMVIKMNLCLQIKSVDEDGDDTRIVRKVV